MWRLLTSTKSASGPFGRMALLQQQESFGSSGKFSTGLALLKFNNKSNNNFQHQSRMAIRMISTIGGRTTKPLDAAAAAKSSAAAEEDKAAAKTALLLRRRQKWRKFVGEVRLFLRFPVIYIGSILCAAWALVWVLDLLTDREGKREKLRWKLSKMHASTIGVAASWLKKKNGQKDFERCLPRNALEKQQEQPELLILPDGKTVINRNAASEWVNVRAKQPFLVETTASSSLEPGEQKIFYFEVLVKENYDEIAIGLSGPEFPLLRNYAFVGSEGNSLGLKSNGLLWQFGKNDTQFAEERRKSVTGDAGNVLGCGLLFVGREQQAEEGNGGGEAAIAGKQEMPGRLFFTRNGKIFGRPLWLPSAADKLTQLYPTVSLRGQGTAVEVNLGMELKEKPFYYDLAKHPGLTTTT